MFYKDFYFLENIYNQLKGTGKSFKMIYFSDHGQVVKDGSIIHGNGYKEVYDVPLIIWKSDYSDILKINKVRYAWDFLHLFSEMNNAKVSNFKRNYTFISEEQAPNRQVLDSGDNFVDYDKMKNNSIKSIIKNIK